MVMPAITSRIVVELIAPIAMEQVCASPSVRVVRRWAPASWQVILKLCASRNVQRGLKDPSIQGGPPLHGVRGPVELRVSALKIRWATGPAISAQNAPLFR